MRAFFEKRQNLLLFLAARARSMEVAEDLVQELYLRLAGAEAAGEVRAPEALLYRMAANLLIDHARSQQRSQRRSADWRRETRTSAFGEDVSAELAADETLVARERIVLLAAAVAELPPQMGRAFRLHKLDGLSQADTAERMGVSRKTVEHHIQAAIARLAERLRT